MPVANRDPLHTPQHSMVQGALTPRDRRIPQRGIQSAGLNRISYYQLAFKVFGTTDELGSGRAAFDGQ
jgi:hypothetical protein